MVRRHTPLTRMLTQARTDDAFRAQVLGDSWVTQQAVHLPAPAWRTLVAAVLTLEAELAPDPLHATELDHGEEDAAGAKG